MKDKKQLSDVERLALAQALYKTAAELVSTKDPTSLRSKVDRAYKELYDVTGSRSFDVKLNGQKVGTYSIKFSKPKPQESQLVFKVNDWEALAKWFDAVGDDEVREYVSIKDLFGFAEWMLHDSGELADGCEIGEARTLGDSGHYIGGTFKVDNKAVADAVRETLPQGFVGMLEGGAE